MLIIRIKIDDAHARPSNRGDQTSREALLNVLRSCLIAFVSLALSPLAQAAGQRFFVIGELNLQFQKPPSVFM